MDTQQTVPGTTRGEAFGIFVGFRPEFAPDATRKYALAHQDNAAMHRSDPTGWQATVLGWYPTNEAAEAARQAAVMVEIQKPSKLTPEQQAFMREASDGWG